MSYARSIRWVGWVAVLIGLPTTAAVQVLEAVDDRYAVPLGLTLQVDAFGVLDNDLLDGENAGESGAMAVLVTDVTYGVLTLNGDGSFTYQIGAAFDGTDSFVYRAEFGAASDEATVVLSACAGGPDEFTCWNESAFTAEVQSLGLSTFHEGFEDEATWGGVRTPDSAPSVVSQGIEWRSNHPDPPASNPISTTSGPPHTGLWAVYDPEHGYATGTPTECDIDDPPEHCLYHDGVSGTRLAGEGVLHGVGAYVNGTFGANVGILIDGAPPVGGGVLTTGHRFFGYIDARPAGFTDFEYRELDGKVGQALFVWADDFTIVTDAPLSVHDHGGTHDPDGAHGGGRLCVSPNPVQHGASIGVALHRRAHVRLAIYDVCGRVVRELLDAPRGAGEHTVTWDGCDARGRRVVPGVYFARLAMSGSGARAHMARRVVVVPD